MLGPIIGVSKGNTRSLDYCSYCVCLGCGVHMDLNSVPGLCFR